MEHSRQPGIYLESIHLVGCLFSHVDMEADRRFSLHVDAIERAYSDDSSRMMFEVAFDLMHEVDSPPCTLKCRYVAVYGRHEDALMSWDEFGDHLPLAHIMPYVRELVTSITARSPLGPLVVQPVNTQSLLPDSSPEEGASSSSSPAD